MKKNLLYGFFALSMAIMGISSCAPMDSDDHSLGGSVVSQDALSLTVSEGADNTYTITNSSQDLDDIRYFISTDGKKLEEFAVGASITCQFKKKGSYPVYLYAFSACDQKVLSHNIEVTENWVDPNAPTDGLVLRQEQISLRVRQQRFVFGLQMAVGLRQQIRTMKEMWQRALLLQ